MLTGCWQDPYWNKLKVNSASCWFFLYIHITMRGTRKRSWLRHCATSRKVAASIPDGVIGIFHWHNPSGRTMVLRLTQLLTEISYRDISWGLKTAFAWSWQPYHLHVPIVLKSGSLSLLEPSGPVQACNGIALPLPLYITMRGKQSIKRVPSILT